MKQELFLILVILVACLILVILAIVQVIRNNKLLDQGRQDRPKNKPYNRLNGRNPG
jgi:NADH:ubiquinone oxidoreductase subunit 3 (subunit A)